MIRMIIRRISLSSGVELDGLVAPQQIEDLVGEVVDLPVGQAHRIVRG